MVGGDKVAVAFVLGYRREIGLPHVGVDVRRTAVVVPVDFAATQQEDPAEHQLGDAVGVRLRVGEPERRTPRAAEDLPALDVEVRAQRLHVGDQLGCGVHREVGAVGDVGARLSASALVEQDDSVARGVEEASLIGAGASAGAAVDEHRRLAVGVA